MRKKRKGETLAEILMALLVFGIILGGVSDFIANHTTLIARIKQRDELIYWGQWYMSRLPENNSDDGKSYISDDIGLTITSNDGHILVVKHSASMDFTIR